MRWGEQVQRGVCAGPSSSEWVDLGRSSGGRSVGGVSRVEAAKHWAMPGACAVAVS